MPTAVRSRSDRLLPYLMERGAREQWRGLDCWRRANEGSKPVSTARRRALLLGALEHLHRARHLLEYAHIVAEQPEVTTRLAAHLGRLAHVTARTAALLRELDGPLRAG